ncbi:hypothetical protein GCM10010195_18860 [Kitasatospora griseola]|nr:hypothetical protein GCM10010195_18860 [Kitasatospora griseola]
MAAEAAATFLVIFKVGRPPLTGAAVAEPVNQCETGGRHLTQGRVKKKDLDPGMATPLCSANSNDLTIRQSTYGAWHGGVGRTRTAPEPTRSAVRPLGFTAHGNLNSFSTENPNAEKPPPPT